MLTYKAVLVLFGVLGYLALCQCDALPDIQSDNTSSILSTLKNFEGARNHETRPEGKQRARDLIKKTFEKNGLQVWTERAQIGKSLYAENIVGMVRSNSTGTADDKIVIVGAHYDTDKDTPGVDDNGSGVTALLQAAKNIGKAKCEVKNTIMFVAFDFEELTENCTVKTKWPISCGSNRYVKNLTSYLNGTGGTVSGALILETMLNHNSSADSQMFPGGFERLLPEVASETKNDSNRGNFLAVVGRKESDKTLLSLISKHFVKDSKYRAQLMEIPISGRPSLNLLSRFYSDLYRSDHYEFWEANASHSALMLTDTADFRGYMKYCYHKECDNLDNVADDDLEFLRRTINAVIKTVLELSGADSCNGGGDGGTGVGVAGATFNLISMLATLLGVFFIIN